MTRTLNAPDQDISTAIDDVASNRLAAVLNIVAPDDIEQLIVQLVALRHQAHLDVLEAARSAVGGGDPATGGTFDEVFDRMDVRIRAEGQAAREHVAVAGGERAIMAGVRSEAVSPASVAARLITLAVQVARQAEHVDMTTLVELDRLGEGISLTTIRSSVQHVSWVMPRDMDAVLRARTGLYWTDRAERPMFGREALSALRADLAAFADETAAGESFMQLYKRTLEPQGRGGEYLGSELVLAFPDVARDVLGLIEQRVHNGRHDMSLADVAREMSEQLDGTWAREDE